MSVKLKALRNRVVIIKDTPAETSRGGIIIPDVCKEKPITGIVQSVNPDYINPKGYTIQTDVKAGDHVLFSKFVGINARVRGKEFAIIEAKDILAVLPKSV